MGKYIRISNTAENGVIVPRIALEKLGLSTKRDSSETIGRFGSGIKFAPIAALRNGWEWWFVGNDNNGPYYMQYIVRKEDGVDCIWYDYGDDVKPSSFTLGAGELSWTDAFQIIREPIANAMDGVKEFGGEWSIDIVDEIGSAVSDCFEVYITASPELISILDNIDLYFSHNRKVLAYSGYRDILEKKDQTMRVFSQNVLVYQDSEIQSMFDYEFGVIELNEERTIKSEWDLCWAISSTIRSVTDQELMSRILSQALNQTPYFEFEKISSSNYTGMGFDGDWVETFTNIYGSNAVIYPNNAMSDSIKQSLRLRGSVPVFVENEGAYGFLCATGIPNYMTSLGEEFEYDIEDDISYYGELVRAISFVKAAIPDASELLDHCGVLKGEASLQCKGLTINKDNPDKVKILVSEDHLNSGSVSDIVATLVHEYDHASTGIGDGYSSEGKQFRDLADKRIGQMIVKHYKPNPFFIEDGVVCFKVSDMAIVGGELVAITEHVRMLDCFLMKIGNFVFKAFGDEIEENFGHEHQPHFCQGATVVSYPTFINVERIEIV